MRTAVLPLLSALVLTAAPGFAAPAAPGAGGAKRPVAIDDLNDLVDVSEPAISPDGGWVAYTVTRVDAKRDTTDDDLYMTSWDGARTVRLTSSKADENSPAFSPDGKYLAFLSRREHDDEKRQLWLMSREGGEGERVTDLPGGISDYVFSPDGRRVVLVADDPEPEPEPPAGADTDAGDDEDREPTPRPIVIDRYQFKADIDGYLGAERAHLYVLDLATRKVEQITSGQFDDHLPNWSPDGKTIVFVSKRSPDPDRDDNYDLWLVEAKAGATPRRLTLNEVPDASPDWESRPVFSPDGASIAYLEGGPLKDIYYAGYHLAIIPAAGGARRMVVPDLDRNMTKPRFTTDGRSILFLLEDDGSVHLARVPASGGAVERILSGPRTVIDFVAARDGRVTALHATPIQPAEVFAVDGSTLRPLSKRNDAWVAARTFATTETFAYKSNDGTTIHAFLVKPAGFKAGRKYPTILDIHGGPVSQYQHEFIFDWQVFAANGYVVVGPNPRGSSGRGEEFSKAIYADWGNKDGQDVRSAVDHLIAQGIADPERLAVSGWSYGGILSNYVIVQDQRFKAAVVGAGSSNFLADYGTDQYIREYDAELGPPWENLDLWIRLSSAFLHADRITTPTLFICGQDDFNVPLLSSEQMYQALKTLRRDTQLVIYPDQFHGLDVPSYLRDRIKRNLDWFGKYLKK